MIKNYGLNLELEKKQQTSKDWKFGSLSQPCLAQMPPEIREQYLPKGEVQRGAEDFMDCTSRAPINQLENKFNYLYQNNKLAPENKVWLEKNGYVVDGRVTFSDRFIAILSNTTPVGNSFRAPLEAIREYGLIPKSMLPASDTMTFSEYHDKSKITAPMYLMGLEWLKRFLINYERVSRGYFSEVLKKDGITVGGNAWPIPVNGEYPRNNGPWNHDFYMFTKPDFTIYDNYEESAGDFIKKLASNYLFVDFGYRVYIAKESVVSEVSNTPIVISGHDRNIILQILQKMTQILQLDLLLLKIRGMFGGWFGKKEKLIAMPDEDIPPPA